STALAERVEALLPDATVGGRREGSQAALLNALLFGRRERLDVSDREAFTASGTAHLLAISGLQIQFLAVLLWRLVGLFGLTRRPSAWLVMAFSCAYCALAGADPPIARATVMIVLYLTATLVWREPEPVSVLGAAALAILLVSPAELFNAGFQLSFLAVLALLTIYPALNDAWDAWRRSALLVAAATGTASGWSWPALRRWLGKYTRTALFVSLAAWVGTAPVVAWHMGRFPSYSLLVNLIAVPLGSLCMVCGLAMLAVGVLSPALGALFGWAAWGSLVALQWVNEVVAAIPGANIDLPAPPLLVLVLYTGALVWIWIDRGRRMKLGGLAAVQCACLLALHIGLLFRAAPAGQSVTVLDLRYGRAALLEAPGARIMLDAGGPGQGSVLAEMLRRRGVSALDLLVISADDAEAIGGAVDLLKRVRVAKVLFPRAGSASAARRELESILAGKNVPYATADGSAAVTIGGVSLECRDDGPPPGTPAPTQSALSVRVTMWGASPHRPAAGTTVLFVNARSSASFQRLFANSLPRDPQTAPFLKADVLRLVPGPGAHWPPETVELIQRSGCGVIIAGAGHDLDDCTGLDLAVLAEERQLTLLSPRRDGTIRVRPRGPADTAPVLQAFRKGLWRAVETPGSAR
ncbi:MAG: ComEC/Rec2 family competence protein, partial [Planctomycetota bacterium]|nr:ComEC/Rec2 family competence protein [Planctomycetota bacterium]